MLLEFYINVYIYEPFFYENSSTCFVISVLGIKRVRNSFSAFNKTKLNLEIMDTSLLFENQNFKLILKYNDYFLVIFFFIYQ